MYDGDPDAAGDDDRQFLLLANARGGTPAVRLVPPPPAVALALAAGHGYGAQGDGGDQGDPDGDVDGNAVAGAIIVADCVEGLVVNTLTEVHHTVATGCPLVLVLNKVDRMIFELVLEPEEAYASLERSVYNAQAMVSVQAEGLLDDLVLSPALGNVVFASSRHGWAFSLATFAAIWSDRFPDHTEAELAGLFWGANYYDGKRKAWQTSPLAASNGRLLQRGFVQFVYEPLVQLLRMAREADDAGDAAAVCAALEGRGVALRPGTEDLTGRDLYAAVACAWIPLSDAVYTAVADHLPPCGG